MRWLVVKLRIHHELSGCESMIRTARKTATRLRYSECASETRNERANISSALTSTLTSR